MSYDGVLKDSAAQDVTSSANVQCQCGKSCGFLCGKAKNKGVEDVEVDASEFLAGDRRLCPIADQQFICLFFL